MFGVVRYRKDVLAMMTLRDLAGLEKGERTPPRDSAVFWRGQLCLLCRAEKSAWPPSNAATL